MIELLSGAATSEYGHTANLFSGNLFPPVGPALALFDGGIWDIIGHSSFFGIVIMSVLLGFSVVSWAIIVTRMRLFRREEREADDLLEKFNKSKRLADTVNLAKQYQSTTLGSLLSSGIQELVDLRDNQSDSPAGELSLGPLEVETLEARLDEAASDEMGRLGTGVTFLATTANASPFLGLLGTVVGIMVSFWEIGQTGSASLAIVAPGIAEALLATIFGLGAAIPAVIAYNWANSRLRQFAERAANFNQDFVLRVRREFAN
ncbi:MAG: MotA/TolQ/ExbB proton channel family protein [Candidatus Zixiibacteriota bacterium]